LRGTGIVVAPVIITNPAAPGGVGAGNPRAGLSCSGSWGYGSCYPSMGEEIDTSAFPDPANDPSYSDDTISCGPDDDWKKDCKLVDADVTPTHDYSLEGVDYLGVTITCWYQCPDLPFRLGTEHFISHELAFLFKDKSKALAFCPSTM
jgi:hypothetical protein